jgi:phosphomannomutase
VSELTSNDLVARVRAWIDLDHDESTKAELASLLQNGDYASLDERFSSPLTFGTAGLRGPLHAGPSGMNRRNVRRATQAVAAWLHTLGPEAVSRGVVVGRDARHGSEVFFQEVLEVLATYNVPAWAYRDASPTPLVAFGVLAKGASAGIMITASHNPKGDNGFKLYVADGAQVISPVDQLIEALMRSEPELSTPLPAEPNFAVGDELLARYLDRQRERFPLRACVPLVYTPMHGVGGDLFVRLTEGYQGISLVAEQFRPDGDFPTVTFPNPEEAGALDCAIATADRVGADLIIANDPDADRIGVAVRSGGRFVQLTGDETGWLLAERAFRNGVAPGDVVATSIVSSRLLSVMAAAHDVRCVTTLTGFKWIARADGQGRLAFGYEEALGYAVDPAVRDKDGLSAALALIEVADELAKQGLTLLDELGRLRAAYGDVHTRQLSFRANSPAEMTAIRARLASLTSTTLDTFGGFTVAGTYDLTKGYQGLASTTGVVIDLGERARVILRPSGTEPKIKAYIEVVRESPDDTGLNRLADAVSALFSAN